MKNKHLTFIKYVNYEICETNFAKRRGKGKSVKERRRGGVGGREEEGGKVQGVREEARKGETAKEEDRERIYLRSLCLRIEIT